MGPSKTALLVLLAVLTSCSRLIPNSPEPSPATVEDREPSFSPDGDSIAFAHWSHDRSDSLRPSGLYVIGARGGTPRLVIRGSIMSPDWSPDGRWIAFVHAYGSPLFVVSPTGDSLRQITTFSGFYPS